MTFVRLGQKGRGAYKRIKAYAEYRKVALFYRRRRIGKRASKTVFAYGELIQRRFNFVYLPHGGIGAPPTLRVTANNVACQNSSDALRAINLAVAVAKNVIYAQRLGLHNDATPD